MPSNMAYFVAVSIEPVQPVEMDSRSTVFTDTNFKLLSFLLCHFLAPCVVFSMDPIAPRFVSPKSRRLPSP